MFLSASTALLALLVTQASGYGCGAHHNGSQNWDEAIALANDFVAQLTLEEKVGMLQGNSSAGACVGNINAVPRLGFRGLCMLDGPNGLNRNDQGGRNWEGFGPDPYLAGVVMEASVRGIHDAGAQTCAKHYIVNEQETMRNPGEGPVGDRVEALSSNVDDRAMHELYLWPFANAVRAGTGSFMCGYNRANNEYACESGYLLKELLRDELGFKGFVVSDWFATHSTYKAVNAGLDMEMPGVIPSRPQNPAYFGKKLIEALANGTVTQDRIDGMVRNIMASYFFLGQHLGEYPTVDPAMRFVVVAHQFGLSVARDMGILPPGQQISLGRDVRGNHAKLIREHGAAGTVLLKNTNNTLPVKAPRVIGVFGNDAADMTLGFNRADEHPPSVNSGTTIIGGGSGTVRPSYVVPPLEAIKAKGREIGAAVLYITDNEHLARNDFRGIYPIPEICFVFQQSFASESFDRTDLELDGNSTVVINNVANFCDNTVVITHSGGINTMPWADHPKIGAILAAHYPGQESGNAIVDLLWGDVVPSGRLPYTIPLDAADADVDGIDPLYEFGFGLTYTTFSVVDGSLSVSASGDVALSARPDPRTNITVGGHPELWETVAVASVDVTNTGGMEAPAVPQLYMSFPDGATPEGTPIRVLRGFGKVVIAPGETVVVQFPLMRRDVSYWDVNDKVWVIPEGEFVFRAGFSSRDLPLEARITLL
ncbi:beta-glucosidase [Plectosphaerella plurivora]|uniref:beta-glucosidase n=1 Tax=Plectosphaerella plurivora TaxID=936078 RepID=A0A9P9AAL2_9PEZI|nr:beta-glucosidase [Plectosphaerella plurivora]